MSVNFHRPSWDYELFHWFNFEDGSFLWTQAMRWASDESWWGFAFATALVFSLFKKKKKLREMVLLALLSLGVSDGVAFYGIKSNIETVRPCFVLKDYRLRALKGCGSKPSFPSNHSSNAMAVATVVSLMAPWKSLKLLAILLALVVGYSRVYLGVHYPLDVFAGWGLGALVGILVFLGYRAIQPRIKRAQHPLLPSWRSKRTK